jgi:cytochrome c oxidase subunit 1
MAAMPEARHAASERRPPETGIWSWITTVDHKRIGFLYLSAALLFFILGGVEAFLIRLQLAQPDGHVLGANLYNEMFTMHGTTMIFFVVMPMLVGFINFVVPLQIGARDVAFPRLNALSYWLFLGGGIVLYASWFMGGAPNSGWFAYAPISLSPYTPGPGLDFYDLGLQLSGIGTIMTGVNFLTTIVRMRAPGMSFMRLPLFVWGTFITSILIIFAFPPLTTDLFLLMFERWFGANFFNAAGGGNVVLWAHLFWLFGHPEVYILVMPAFGIISEVVATFSRKPIFGYSSMVAAFLAIGFLSFMVWSHHMFAFGMGPVVNAIFSITTMIIAVPTGIKIFNWLGTMWGGKVRFTTAMLFSIAFIPMFVIGGLSGVMSAMSASDLQQNNSYFIVAHFHYVLGLGSLMAIFAGFFYWFPKMTGRMMNERLGKWCFWTLMVGFNVTFFPMHFIGMLGMPRRIYTYSPHLGLGTWNLISTIGVPIIGVGALLFFWNLIASLRHGEIAAADPWDARTLEWSLPSPVPAYDFAHVPLVRGRDAFWLEKAAGGGRMLPAEVAGASGAPDRGGAAGFAEGSHVPGAIHMPSPTALPALMGLGLLIACFGGLRHDAWVAAAGFLVAFYALFRWMFDRDQGYHVEPEGEGL